MSAPYELRGTNDSKRPWAVIAVSRVRGEDDAGVERLPTRTSDGTLAKPHERVKTVVGGIVAYAPDYSVPGIAERVGRECLEAELGTLTNISSSTSLYLLRVFS